MSKLDTLRNIFGGSGANPMPVELSPGEREQARYAASYRPGSVWSVAGDLVVTNRRVNFLPLDPGAGVELLTWALEATGAPGDRITEAAVDRIVAVMAGHNGSLVKPPTLHLVTVDDCAHQIGVVAGRHHANNHPASRRARDRAVAQIQAWLHV